MKKRIDHGPNILTIMVATLFVGSLDLLAAILQTLLKGRDVDKLFQFIASGVFGLKAFSGGIEMIVYGILFHFLIAMIWTILFFVLYPWLVQLIKNTITLGLLYGVFISLIMSFFVVPMSNAPAIAFSLGTYLISACILIIAVGIPLAFLAKRASLIQ